MRTLPAYRRVRLACSLAAMLATVAPATVYAAESWQTGNIVDVSAVPQGMLIKLDTGLPTNCAGASYGWMLVPESNRVMVATTLALWLSGKRHVDVYTVPVVDSLCVVNQVDARE